ncbi:type II secretion system protein GspL [Janthinobacterium sp. B9-8]|uniref:type II secretion system protein GspL n=1 Tax=Janthinobacterium sp. B9-8 TaxID=1236179 RepID=UPI00061CF372|nr:type II secretion system protein GspL [Janthinobacterium sp. B9-8]AMC34687.1 hypothetical protein VN23_08745 [Janthinobacterium sp. B9-8]
MNDHIHTLLRILPACDLATTEVRWFTEQASGSATLSALPPAQRIELIVPAALSNIYIAELPKQSLARRYKLLPHLLEDRLLSPAATLHFGLKDQSNKIIAVERKWLERCLSLLAEHQITPSAAWSLYDFLPEGTNWCIALDQQACLVRTPEGQYSQFEDTSVLDGLIGDAPREDLILPDLIQHTEPGTNLLQGDFAQRSQWQFDWKTLQTPALLLSAIFAVVLLGQIGDWWQLRSTKLALQREMRQTYAAAFPGEPVFDPILQLQSKLREGGGLSSNGAGDSLDLLLQVANIAGSGLQLEQLEYANGSLSLELPDSQASSLQTQLKGAGLSAETQAATTGRMKVLVRAQAVK